MDQRWARPWFAATAVAVFTGLVINVFVAADNTTGHFHTAGARVLNVFSYFTIQSNLIVGVTTLLLALSLNRASNAFRAFRLIGVVAIAVTGVVYHVAIAHLLELDSWALAGDQLVHTVVPILAVLGWLMFGPRRLTSARIAKLTIVFPTWYFALTLIRGPLVNDFYPYHFADVKTLGYLKVLINGAWIGLLFVALAAGAAALDKRISPTKPDSPTETVT